MRDFGVAVANMLTGSSARRLGYIDREADFFGFDPDRFGPTFKDLWRDSITASYAIPSDETRDDEQEVLTDRVLALMAEGSRMYIDLKYWVGRAFPTDRGIRNYFGIDTYSDRSSSQAAMLIQLGDMVRGVNHTTHGPVLVAAGYDAAKVTALNTLFTDLQNENAEQDNFIADSPEATVARNAQYNRTYAFDRAVNEASKVVYYGNAVLLNRFTLPASGNSTDNFNITGLVTDSETGLPHTGATVKVVGTGIVTTSDSNGLFGLTEVPAGAQTLEVAATGRSTRNVNVNVPSSGAIVQNVALDPLP